MRRGGAGRERILTLVSPKKSETKGGAKISEADSRIAGVRPYPPNMMPCVFCAMYFLLSNFLPVLAPDM